MKTLGDCIAVLPVDLHAATQSQDQALSRFVNFGAIKKLVELKVAFDSEDAKIKAGQSVWVWSSALINNKEVYTFKGQEVWLLEKKYIVLLEDGNGSNN